MSLGAAERVRGSRRATSISMGAARQHTNMHRAARRSDMASAAVMSEATCGEGSRSSTSRQSRARISSMFMPTMTEHRRQESMAHRNGELLTDGPHCKGPRPADAYLVNRRGQAHSNTLCGRLSQERIGDYRGPRPTCPRGCTSAADVSVLPVPESPQKTNGFVARPWSSTLMAASKRLSASSVSIPSIPAHLTPDAVSVPLFGNRSYPESIDPLSKILAAACSVRAFKSTVRLLKLSHAEHRFVH